MTSNVHQNSLRWIFNELNQVEMIEGSQHWQRGGFHLAAGRIRDYEVQLTQEEAAVIEKSVPKRRLEYSTGRMLAKKALTSLSPELLQTPISIGRGAGREPIWPPNVVGALTHSEHVALAVVTDNKNAMGVGIDIELADRVRPDLAKMILTETERDHWLRSGSTGHELALYFSAKEAVFKAVNPMIGLMIDYTECLIQFVDSGSSFSATYVGTNVANSVMDAGLGIGCSTESHVITAFVLA